jgi:hypothetical protein
MLLCIRAAEFAKETGYKRARAKDGLGIAESRLQVL